MWQFDFANVNTNPGPQNVDIIDQLPKQGVDLTNFHGTLAFDKATVVQGDEPNQAVEVLYTRNPNVDKDPGNTTNDVVTGGTVWCSLSGGTFTRVLGSGSSAACPTSPADVTGVRVRRPGTFGPGDQISVQVQMTPSSNAEGDVYVNGVAGRAEGLTLLVGPALAPATVVASSVGDFVWDDANLNGIQDAGEAPIAGFKVSLQGTDTDGNAVGPLTTTTDANGAYHFTGLQSGDYTVTFDPASLGAAQHFTVQDAGANDLVDSDGDVTTGVAHVTLAANTNNDSVDQGVFTADPKIHLTKYINGDDANTAPGVLVEPGSDMAVTFDVHNTGNLTLDPVKLTDDKIATADISCPKTVLAPDETMTCTATYPAPAAGTQHTNTATVVGTPVPLPDGTQLDDVTDDDPANAYGIVRKVSITKDLVGDPVPNGDGTYTVTYDVKVTNEGTQAATYDLDDQLHFGAGAAVTGASVTSGPAGVTLNPAWDGQATTRIASNVDIPLAGVHTYRVEATASLAVETVTHTSSDCTLDQGETGTGFLNSAAVSSDGATSTDDACGPMPHTTFHKALVGTPTRNGDGTTTIRYDVVVTNDGAAPDHYDLVDALHFGGGITVQSATVANTAPGSITPDASWDGTSHTTVVSHQAIGAGATHTYRVTVVARVAGTTTLEQSDCTLQQGEDGTGFLNRARLTVNGIDADDQACAPAPNTSMTKDLFGTPVVEDDGSVTTTYLITVTNTGAADDVYDLDDDLRFGDGITVNSASVSNTQPGSIATLANWDGEAHTKVVADQPIASGATHLYVVTVNATIGTTTTIAQADCTVDQGEQGTGFLNHATLTVNGDQSQDDACGEVTPKLAMHKDLVGSPVRNADGSWKVTYDITVANRIGPNTYDLTDALSYGEGVVVKDASVANTVPGSITTNASWNGSTSKTVATDVAIGAGVTHTYRVVVDATVPTTATVAETDCTVATGESGSGFLNGATVTTATQTLDDDACAPAPNVSMTKVLLGDPVVRDDNTIDVTYAVTVTNTGAGAGRYDLHDDLRFGDGITVNSASVANTDPGDIATNAAWDGATDTTVATDVPIDGASSSPVTHTYVVKVNASIGTTTTIAEADCTLDAGEDGTGLLNHATLTVGDHDTTDEACGHVTPKITVEKRLAGAPTANGDGTWTIDYDVVAKNVGPAPGTYDLRDELAFGKGVSVVSASVDNTDPGGIAVNADWDGINDTAIVNDEPLAVGTSHTYRVEVQASVASDVTTKATDCTVQTDEAGTGFLNTAELDDGSSTTTADACAKVPSIRLVKRFVGTPTVSNDGTVRATYSLTVTNVGSGDGHYDLTDHVRWGGGVTVTGATVTSAPAGQVVRPTWDGLTDTLIAEDVDLAAGATHVWRVEVTGVVGESLTTSSGDCTVSAGEGGTGLLNAATVSSESGDADSAVCTEVLRRTPPPPSTPPTGSLPRTGFPFVGVALAGLAMVAAGAALVGGTASGRRRASAR